MSKNIAKNKEFLFFRLIPDKEVDREGPARMMCNVAIPCSERMFSEGLGVKDAKGAPNGI